MGGWAGGPDLRAFILKTRERLNDQAAAHRAAEQAKEGKAAASVDLETFRKECQVRAGMVGPPTEVRIAQKLLAKMPQVDPGKGFS